MKNPFFNRLLRFFGSIKLAILLILLFAVVLVVATFFESAYGTDAVQYSIYKTIWFGALLLLIGLSVTAAALKKYPWKKRQLGFVITHLGIVILIIGSFISFWWGIDASLPLLNGEESGHLLLNEKTIGVELPEKKISDQRALVLGPYLKETDLLSFSLPLGASVVVDRYLPFARPEEKVLEDPSSPHAAIELQLVNDFVNFNQWLMMDERGFEKISLGPAQVIFKKLERSGVDSFLKPAKKKENGFLGTLKLKTAGQEWEQPLYLNQLNQTLSIAGSSFKVSQLRYFSDAVVQNNTLVNRSKSLNNPAVALMLEGPKGSEKHVAFSYFDDFPSTHQKSSLYGAKLSFSAAPLLEKQTSQLEIGLTSDHQLYYRVSSSTANRSGPIVIGKSYETGWMNIKFQIKRVLAHAKKEVYYMPVQVKDPNNPKAFSAIRFRFSKEGMEPHTAWLGFSETSNVLFGGDHYRVFYHSKIMPLSFSLHLERFEMGTDPGTNNPASYQSHVVLKDPTDQLTQKKLISMNEPLDYKGFTFYQASYQTDEQGHPTGSVLSVGYDPGRVLKYGGSLIMVLGILWMFFFRLKRNHAV